MPKDILIETNFSQEAANSFALKSKSLRYENIEIQKK